MTRGVHFHGVSFQYDGQKAPVFSELTLQLPSGWTGVVGANGAGKTTFLKVAVGDLTPSSGKVNAPANAVYCQQRTDDPPHDLGTFLDAVDGEARMLQGRLRVESDWLDRWDTLSHGERKRAQIGVALWRSPALLAIDEPTNHLDRDARRLLESALATFRGVGLLVSHDRDLLDSLCGQCLFVDPPVALLRPGGVTQGSGEAQREREYEIQQLSGANRSRAKVEGAARKHREEASRADRRRSKRGLARGDSDAREKINRARVSGKDALAGRRLRQLEGRLQQARRQAEKLSAAVKKQSQLGISIPGAPLRRDLLVRIPAGTFCFGDTRTMDHPELTIHPQDRIGLVGPNGSGKSTLIQHILDTLGEDRNVVTYLPQEIATDASKEILDYARSLSGELLGAVMTVVSRLGSEPERLLNSEVPSPGEVRKLVLALGIAQESAFLVLDEPTNHLDLPSIECVESALHQCTCGLLLVSHDERFLKSLARMRWCLETKVPSQTQLNIVSNPSFFN